MKKCIILFFILFSFLNAELKDNINLFTSEEKEKLNVHIEKLYKKYNIKINVITSDYGEGYVLENPERTVVVNIQKGANKKIKIEESFTNDMNMNEKDKELSDLIDGLEHYILEEKYGAYVDEFIEGALSIYGTTEVVELNKENYFLEHKWQIIKWVLIVLTLLNILVRIKYISKKKKEMLKQKEREEELKKIERKEKNSLHHKLETHIKK